MQTLRKEKSHFVSLTIERISIHPCDTASQVTVCVCVCLCVSIRQVEQIDEHVPKTFILRPQPNRMLY